MAKTYFTVSPGPADNVGVSGVTVKSCTARVPATPWVSPLEAGPAVPRRVKAKVPPVEGAWMMTVAVPLPLMVGGLKVAVAPVGRRGASKVTASLKPGLCFQRKMRKCWSD
jgi:hypothetical protein